jgi:hypothetical protein
VRGSNCRSIFKFGQNFAKVGCSGVTEQKTHLRPQAASAVAADGLPSLNATSCGKVPKLAAMRPAVEEFASNAPKAEPEQAKLAQ